MKNKIKFDLFKKEDYLSFSILGLADLEMSTGKTITEIWDDAQNGKFGISLILKSLPIALRDSYPNISSDDVAIKIEQAIENGANINSFVIPVLQAILASGIFGGKKLKAEIPQAEKELCR